ncbi:acyl carrier protein, partial [Streptomyces luteocolor]|uniref:acyl carrier protein n=1 Tax=Streptomyces luteocolor TaxID=285500 RepID=UPI00139050FD
MTVTPGDVLAFVSGRLAVPSQPFEPDRSFVAAGSDSLTLMALARALEAEFGVRVSVRELFTDVDTPGKLAETVSARAAARQPVADPPDAATAPAATAPATPAGPTVSAPSPVPAQFPAEASQFAQPTPVQAPPAAPAPPPASSGGDAYEAALALFTDQLQLAGKMMTRFSELTAEQLKVLSALRPGPAVATHSVPSAPALSRPDADRSQAST